MLSIASPSSFLPLPLLLRGLAKLPPPTTFQLVVEGSHIRCRHYVVAAGISVRTLTVTHLLYDVRNTLRALLFVSLFIPVFHGLLLFLTEHVDVQAIYMCRVLRPFLQESMELYFSPTLFDIFTFSPTSSPFAIQILDLTLTRLPSIIPMHSACCMYMYCTYHSHWPTTHSIHCSTVSSVPAMLP